MAGTDRRAPARLTERRAEEEIARSPHQFDPFQAIRLLLLDRPEGSADLGSDAPPSAEAVRLRSSVTHNFSAAAIDSVEAAPRGENDEPSGPTDVAVNFMGAFGPLGVLPRQHTDALTRSPAEVGALRAFLDLFHHRVISHFYRAWRKYRLPIAYERSKLDPAAREEDPFTESLGALVGIGSPALRHRLAFSDEVLLWFGGHFARRVPSAQGLQQMLRSCVGSGTTVEPLCGAWSDLAPEDRTRLGRPGMGLGKGQIAGGKVWLVQSKFRLRLGPLGLDDFRHFCPGGKSLIPMSQLVRAYVGPTLDYDVQPVLLATEAPRPRLSRVPERRLGVDVWLLIKVPDADLDQAVFRSSGWPQRQDKQGNR